MYPRPEAHSKVSQDVPRAHEPGEVVELGERDTRETREAQRTHRFEIHDIMTSWHHVYCISFFISCPILSYLVLSATLKKTESTTVEYLELSRCILNRYNHAYASVLRCPTSIKGFSSNASCRLIWYFGIGSLESWVIESLSVSCQRLAGDTNPFSQSSFTSRIHVSLQLSWNIDGTCRPMLTCFKDADGASSSWKMDPRCEAFMQTWPKTKRGEDR